MPLSEELLAWSRLVRTQGLGRRALEAMLARFGSASALVAAADAGRERAAICAGLGARLRDTARVRSSDIRWLEDPRHHLLPFTDPSYPSLLDALRDRPVALYVAGDAGALGAPQSAIVGSRNPTRQGAETAFEFAHDLAERGIAITSGLACGIDTAAHRGALAAEGATLAVLGSGVDTVYPRANRPLAEEVVECGALVSEFPPGTPPRRGHFPRRNRIIAALSQATLVVEAARGSGSLISARIAGYLGRKVFAVPGSIHSPLSRGCHELIRNGAKVAESADDILSELSGADLFEPHTRIAGGGFSPVAGRMGLDKHHKILLDALGFDPADLDTLIARSGLKAEAVSSMMLILELEGHVQAAPGGRYSRIFSRRAGGERQRSGSAHLPLRELHERRR
jgi:DNA processing protein